MTWDFSSFLHEGKKRKGKKSNVHKAEERELDPAPVALVWHLDVVIRYLHVIRA